MSIELSNEGSLRSLLGQGQFVVTAEIAPKLTASPDEILKQAQPLKGLADAVNVTDGAGARVAMSSLAASALLVRDGIEPVMQMTCRDRNRIAIAAELIGASALGINRPPSSIIRTSCRCSVSVSRTASITTSCSSSRACPSMT